MNTLPVGTRLGQLTLVAHIATHRFARRKRGWSKWRCTCGREKLLRTTAVVAGYARSCGCAAQRMMRGKMLAGTAEAHAKQRARRPRGPL